MRAPGLGRELRDRRGGCWEGVGHGKKPPGEEVSGGIYYGLIMVLYMDLFGFTWINNGFTWIYVGRYPPASSHSWKIDRIIDDIIMDIP